MNGTLYQTYTYINCGHLIILFQLKAYVCIVNLVACNISVESSKPIKGPVVSLSIEQDSLPSLLKTGWPQERSRAWFPNRTKNNWEPYERLSCLSNKLPCLISSKSNPNIYFLDSMTTLSFAFATFAMVVVYSTTLLVAVAVGFRLTICDMYMSFVNICLATLYPIAGKSISLW